MSALDLFRATYSREPQGVFSAPGRVNLIGEHTDYTGGLVLPFAIDARASLAAAPNQLGVVRVVSEQRPADPTKTVSVTALYPGSPITTGWPAYVLGSIWALREEGHPVSGFDLALDSQVPAGAGLSSSAAVECVTVLAASVLAGVQLPPLEVARLAQRAENDFVGVPCGPMDQTASAAAQAGSVLLFDTRSGSVENIRFDPAAHDLQVLVVDTRVSHSLADGEYHRRRASCERAADLLGVRQLREVTPQDLAATLGRLPEPELRQRVRHVVTENDRVLKTVELLRDDRLPDIGDLLTASHWSLRDDYEVSCPELDQAVETLLRVGALGARMTGGGFGGSVIALLPGALVAAAAQAVQDDFTRRGFTAPVTSVVQPAQGARRDA